MNSRRTPKRTAIDRRLQSLRPEVELLAKVAQRMIDRARSERIAQGSPPLTLVKVDEVSERFFRDGYPDQPDRQLIREIGEKIAGEGGHSLMIPVQGVGQKRE